jgi:hypothetical protein
MSDAPRPSAPPVTPAPPPAPAIPDRPAAQHEFSEEHKDSFRALAASMSFVGVCVIFLSGGLSVVFGLVAIYAAFPLNGVAMIFLGALSTMTGWWMVSAGRSLSALVRTRGRDVDHLMDAVRQLRWLFGFARVVIIVYAMLLSAVFGVVVWCTVLTDKGSRCFAGW